MHVWRCLVPKMSQRTKMKHNYQKIQSTTIRKFSIRLNKGEKKKNMPGQKQEKYNRQIEFQQLLDSPITQQQKIQCKNNKAIETKL